MKHLVFYDGSCGLCDRTVQILLKQDKRELFAFAPLQGETAKKLLQSLPEQYKGVDSMVLVENYETDPKYFVMASAVFRICWLLGGAWKPLGLLYFLPALPFNWAYRWVARHRHRLFGDACVIPTEKTRHRFLP